MTMPEFKPNNNVRCAKCGKALPRDANGLPQARWQGMFLNGNDEWFCLQCAGFEDANGKSIVLPRALRTIFRIMPADFTKHVGREPQTQEEFDRFALMTERNAMGHCISQTDRHDFGRWDSALEHAGREFTKQENPNEIPGKAV